MEDYRSNPEAILRQINIEERAKGRGRLKIFFSYAAGAGKTFAMLKAAQEMKSGGADVVAGYVEPHARPRTLELLEGLEALTVKQTGGRKAVLQEFDLDAAIERKPQVILVDELAHTNAPGSRHQKRYQDINELLHHGIDVYTTLNVQHIESLNDLVASITGIIVQERIPDSVFDNADWVELVDIEPLELIARFKEGLVYGKDQAARALGNFFTEQNLIALREIALRRCADRVNKRSKLPGGCHTEEHILVCLSSSPSNAKIIRTAARMADAFKGRFTALFVETPDFVYVSGEDRERLRKNIQLAGKSGADIETVFGDDVAFQVSEFARLQGVSKIVLGRSSTRRNLLSTQHSLTEKITQLSPELDIYIIPDQSAAVRRMGFRMRKKPGFDLASLLKSVLTLGVSTGIGFLFYLCGFSEANIITVYILGVLVTSVVTSQRWYSLVSSAVSVLLFNFLFTEPRFTFNAYDPQYLTTFPIMLLAAFLTSSLAARIKRQARQAAETAYRTKILLETSQMLGGGKASSDIAAITCKQLGKLLNRDILFYGVENGELAKPVLFSAGGDHTLEEYTTEHEHAVAVWVYRNNKHAGATTATLGDAACLYLSLRVAEDVYGVVGIAVKEPLEAFENSIVLSILGECALALKYEQVQREREAAALLAKNEQLRADLLRSISHDLRTPLTSISGNAGILLSSGESITRENRKQLYADIYDDSLWLINLVENLLSVTRIEDGTMKLRLTTELLDEVAAEALRHTDRRRTEHKICLKTDDTFILVKMDARLITQVIINLVDNAIKYTPEGSEIIIEIRRKGMEAVVSVSDDGYGISDEAKQHLFEMFYTAGTKQADGRRSMGLGLALCKSIITAHGGRITVRDRKPHGAVFIFTLPMEEVVLHE